MRRTTWVIRWAIGVMVLANGITAAEAQSAPTVPTAQPTPGLASGGSLIGPTDISPYVGAALQAMGGRMTTASTAQVTLAGTITDFSGSRTAQITIQSPGYLLYKDAQGTTLAFNGSSIQANSGSLTPANQSIFESLLANFPDSIFLQIATGGGVRRLGSHFRTDNGKTPGYAGPYWTVLAFSPRIRQGLTAGQASQESLFVAFDDKTGLMSDVRTVVTSGTSFRGVTQTQFSNWFQQGGQWFPGTIVRLLDGGQGLSFQTQQATVGPALPTATFQVTAQ